MSGCGLRHFSRKAGLHQGGNPPLSYLGLILLALALVAIAAPALATTPAPIAFSPLSLMPAGVRSLSALAAPQGSLAAPGAEAGGLLGESVAISGNTAIVGSRSATVNGLGDAGAAFVFTRTGTTWTFQQELTADVPAANDGFGIAVAISGDTAIVGSESHHIAATGFDGSATVFTRAGGVWTQSQELYSANTTFNDNYGQAVALEGDTALVSASVQGVPGNYHGSVYAYKRTAGLFGSSQELTGTDVVNAEYFGTSVALDGDTAVVGAFRHNHSYGGYPAGVGSGGAFVFTRSGDTWAPAQELTVTEMSYPNPADYLNSNDAFGCSVAVSGDTALVGARSHWVLGQQKGAVYAFQRTGGVWAQQGQRICPADAVNYDYFGRSVALVDDSALVGSTGHFHTSASDSGASYVFSRSGAVWSETAEFAAADSAPDDGFGSSVALSEDSALVGAPGHSVGGHSQAGAAYVFLRSALSSLEDTTPPAAPSGLKAVAGYRSVTLSWKNLSADYTGTFIYHSTTRYASDAEDTAGQSTMYWGKTTTFKDSSLTAGKRYYFTLFDKDDSNNWSVAAKVSAVPQSYASLGRPSVKPSKPTHGKSFKISGTFSPKHAAKCTVKLRIYKKGSTKVYKTVSVSLKARAASYSASVRLTKKGGYYVKAYHSDAAHAAKYSSARSFTVK